LEGQAFVLDCRSLEFRYFPVDLKKNSIVLCDTMVKHSLASSEYNTRRSECEQGVRVIRQHHPEVISLRDATLAMIEDHKSEFPDKVYNRCRYVVEENDRVLAASHDLENHDLISFGKKMYASHKGLSELYEVSCEELDFLVDESKKNSGVLGSRMMGGGFGGCTINIVEDSSVDDFVSSMTKAYEKKFGVKMTTYVVSIKDGTGII
jgi:galactokinase